MKPYTYALIGTTLAIAIGATYLFAQIEKDEKLTVIDETVIVLIPDEPTSQFKAAHESFVKKEFDKAGAEIRKGAEFVEQEAATGVGKAKLLLIASGVELEKLAASCENKTVTSVGEIEAAFGRAHHALALNHRLKAGEAFAKKETKAAGHELKLAMGHLKQGAIWAGRKAEAGAEIVAAAVVKDAVLVGDKLVQGAGWTVDEVGKCMEATGKEVKKLGTHLENR